MCRRAAEADHRNVAGAAAAGGTAPVHRAGRRLHAGAAGHGAKHGDAQRGGAAAARPAPRLRASPQAGAAALAESPPAQRLTPARRRVLEILRGGRAAVRSPRPRARPGLRRRGGARADRRRSRLSSTWRRPCRRASNTPIGGAPGPKLSPAQERAAEKLVERVESGGFRVTVLDGVTGSGKTETYFAAIAAALAARQAGLGAAARDRAVGAVARALPPPVRGEPGRVAFRYRPRRSGAMPGARSPPGGRASSSARARRCSCRFPSWA